MQVRVDGADVKVDRSTLRSAMDAARLNAQERGRVIVEATIDDHPMSEEELAAPGEEDLTGHRVSFVSADPTALVRVTLLELLPLLEEARGQQQAAADKIATGDVAAAMESLARAFEVWGGVQQAVAQGTELLGLSLEDIRVGGSGQRGEVEGVNREDAGRHGEPESTVATCTRELASTLSEIKRALSAQDLPGLSDALLYDLDDQVTTWQGVLKAVAQAAHEARHS